LGGGFVSANNPLPNPPPGEGALLCGDRIAEFGCGIDPRIQSGAGPARTDQSDPLGRGHKRLLFPEAQRIPGQGNIDCRDPGSCPELDSGSMPQAKPTFRCHRPTCHRPRAASRLSRTLRNPRPRLGDPVRTCGRAASPLAWDDEIAVKLQVDFVQPFFVLPAKQATGLHEPDLPPRKRGIQSLKHDRRYALSDGRL